MANVLRPWLDGSIPTSRGPGILLASGRADVEVAFIERVGAGSARAFYPADQTDNEIVAPCEGGRYWAGAICPATLGADGRISRIFPPLEWSEGGDPLLVGDAEVDRARVQQLAQQAKDRADAAHDAFDDFVPSVNGEITALQDRADRVTQDMLVERDRVNAELGPVKGDLAVLKTETLPALDTRLTAAKIAADKAAADLLIEKDRVNGELTPVKGDLSTLKTTTIPNLQTALTNVEGAAQSADKRSTVSTAAPSATTGFPQNAVWQRIKASGEVIGSWRLSGSSWVAMPLDPVVIPNLSAGIITSGVINTNRLNAQEIAAAVGSFLELNTGQITWDNAAGNNAFIGSLVGNNAFLERLYANRIVVTPDNLIPDPTFSYVTTDRGAGEGWDAAKAGSGSTAIRWRGSATTGYFDLMITRSGSADSSVQWQPCNGGDSYLLTYRVYKANYPNFRWQVNYESTDGTRGWVAGPTITTAGSSTATQIWEFTLPATAAKFSIRAYIRNPDGLTTGIWAIYGDSLALRRKTGSVLIEDGAVNADKITASQELSAKVAEFLSVKTEQITWDNAAGNNAFIGSLVGDDAFLERLYANQIVVASDNLVADPRFEQTLGIAWTGGPGSLPSYSISNDATLGPSIRYNAAVGSGWRELAAQKVPASPGEVLVASCRARTSGTNWGSYAPRFCVWFYDASGTRIASPAKWIDLKTANTDYSFEATAPDGTAYACYALSIPNGATAGTAVLAMPTLKRKVGSVLIEDGAVVADKLAAKLALVTRLIAGPEDGYHTEISQTGLQFFSKLKGITNPVQALAINTPGTDKEDSVFELRNPNDLASATAMINVAGQASFSDLSVPNLAAFEDVAVKGRTLEAMIEAASPRLVLDSKLLGSVITGSWPDGTDSANIARLAAVSIANPYDYAVTIMIQPTVIPVYTTGNMVIRAYWNYTVGDNPADPGKSYVSAKVSGSVRTGAAGDKQVIVPAVPITIPAGQRVNAHLLCYGHASSGGTYSWTVPSAEEIVVQAVMLGALDPDWDTVLSYVDKTPTQSVTPGTAKKTYVMTVKSSWLRAFYRDSGAYNSYYAGKAVHGSYSNAASTAHKGAIGFADFTAALAGSTVTKVRARIQLAHTYQGSGAKIGVGLHTALNAPASMSGGSALATTGVITAGGAGWVTLPMDAAQREQLRTGGLRGLLLYPPSNSTSVYGYASIAPNQYLEITYTK